MSETAETPAKAGNSKKLIGGILAAAIAGIAVGNFVVAPRLGAAASDSHEVVEEEDHGGGDSHGKGGPRQVRIDNLIVNPAGTSGSRFVVVTIVYEVADETAEGRLKSAEVQLRDAAASTLEQHSLESLTRAGARDSLRAEFLRIATPVLKGAKAKVFLPQFLIQ